MSDVNTVQAANQQLVGVAVAVKVQKIQNDTQKQVLDLLQQVFSTSVGAAEPGKGRQIDSRG